MKILNLTQHAPTNEQELAGVVQPESEDVRHLLTFDTLPSQEDIERRATGLAAIAKAEGATAAMIGGAPWLMGELEQALLKRGIEPLYAFTQRESVERALPDGSVQKTNVFRHVGFVRGYYTEGCELDAPGY